MFSALGCCSHSILSTYGISLFMYRLPFTSVYRILCFIHVRLPERLLLSYSDLNRILYCTWIIYSLMSHKTGIYFLSQIGSWVNWSRHLIVGYLWTSNHLPPNFHERPINFHWTERAFSEWGVHGSPSGKRIRLKPKTCQLCSRRANHYDTVLPLQDSGVFTCCPWHAFDFTSKAIFIVVRFMRCVRIECREL